MRLQAPRVGYNFWNILWFSKLTSILSDGGLIAMELMGRDVNRRLREIIYGSEFNEVDIFANSDLFMPTHTPEASAKLAHILFSTPTSQLNRKIQNIKDST